MSVVFNITDVESELNKRLLADFHGERTKFVQAGPKKYLFPFKYEKLAGDYYNFKLRSDDIWICTYPRSGTTLMQEMVWLIRHDLDYEVAAAKDLMQRFPFIEFSIVVHDELKNDIFELIKGDSIKEEALSKFGVNAVPELNIAPSPRLIKTHLPLSLLPPSLVNTCKVIYVARNPKDTAASFYHHNRLLSTQGYVGDFPTYWDYFERNLLPWCPYWEHIHEAWNVREEPNVLLLFYEDIVKDMSSVIRKVAQFLGKPMTEDQVIRLADHLHIDNFRKNPSTNGDAEFLPGLKVRGEQAFIRKGQNGSWKAEFTPELSERADKWIAENIVKIPGFAFPEP